MGDKFTFSSAGQVHEVEMAMDRAGQWNASLVKRMCEGDKLVYIRDYLLNLAEIKPVGEDATRVITINETTNVVNLAATPKLPFDGAEVESHIGEGWAVIEKHPDGLYVNGRKVVLHLYKRQQNGKLLQGHSHEFREELTGKSVLNANILDALYDNPHLIPEGWKKDEQGNIRYIYFWGTIYCYSHGSLCVRYLCFVGGAWNRSYDWLYDLWLSSSSAALLASS